jgi:hypothetical protein
VAMIDAYAKGHKKMGPQPGTQLYAAAADSTQTTCKTAQLYTSTSKAHTSARIQNNHISSCKALSTMATLILCYGMLLDQCGTIAEYAYPSIEACQIERKYIVANRTQHFVYAVCRMGPPTPPKS